MAVPLYLSEIVPRALRGSIVAMNYAFIALGIAISYTACYFINDMWRWVCILPTIPAIVQMLGLFKMPRSFRWTYMNSAVGDVKQEMRQFYGSEGQLELETEYESIKIQVLSVESDLSLRQKFSFLFKEYRRGTLIASMLFIFHQFSSFTLAMYYAPQILQECGFDLQEDNKAKRHFIVLWAIPFAFISFIATLVTICSVDTCGRRKLLLAMIPFSSTALFILSIALSMIDFQHEVSASVHWVCLVALFIFCIFYSIGIGSVTWIIGAEIFPLKVRGLGVGLVNFVNFTSRVAFMVLFYFTSQTKPGLTVILIFVLMIGGGAWVFIYYCLKETQCLFLQEIQKLYVRNIKDLTRSLYDSDVNSTCNNEETKDRVEELPVQIVQNRDSRWLEQQLHDRRTYTITEESYQTDSLLSEKN